MTFPIKDLKNMGLEQGFESSERRDRYRGEKCSNPPPYTPWLPEVLEETNNEHTYQHLVQVQDDLPSYKEACENHATGSHNEEPPAYEEFQHSALSEQERPRQIGERLSPSSSSQSLSNFLTRVRGSFSNIRALTKNVFDRMIRNR